MTRSPMARSAMEGAEWVAGPRLEPARRAARGMVCTVDHLASGAGLGVLSDGGTAADAAIAASAALAVTTQHMCGMGGDLWALVHAGSGPPDALNSSGRAGSGSDAAALRSEGFTSMPFRGDLRSVPVPGCVDGWLSLHERHGRLPLERILAPAVELAEEGFPPTTLLDAAIDRVVDLDGADDYRRYRSEGGLITRTGLGRSLRAIVAEGRSGWYEGEFGHRLLAMGDGLYDPADFARPASEWVEPIGVPVWGHTFWTVPANSQGYVTALAASLVAGLDGLPATADDSAWAHALIEASKQAAFDRAAILFEDADLSPLFTPNALAERRRRIDRDQASAVQSPVAGGGTIYLCAVDGEGMGVSLMQSNAAGFGAHIAVPEVGVFLHNRGIGFSLEPGHPAELSPGRRPPSTLCPALVTGPADELRMVLGTMGGDGQPQVVLQLLSRILQAGEPVDHALSAPRFTLTVPDAVGFDTWARADVLTVAVERGSPWEHGLATRGHAVSTRPWGESLFGHAHLIDVDGPWLVGVAEPRALASAAIGR